MFLQSGGGGKGIRPSQQNQHSHQQTTHHHQQHLHHQTHNAHAQQQQQQQQLQQQQQQAAAAAAQIQHHVFIPQQQSANHSHLPLTHVSHHQQQLQQQQVHQQQVHHQQQLQQQQTNQAQNPLQQPPLIFYGNPPPHTAQYVGQPPSCTNVGPHQTAVHMAAASSPVQVSSNSSLVSTNGNNGGVLTTSGSNTSIMRPINNGGLQHYSTAPSGLIATQPQAGPGATYMTTAYLNYNPAAVLTAAAQAAVAFNANSNGGGPPGAPTATYYSTTQPPNIQQQKSMTQQQAIHHASQPTPITLFHTSNPVAAGNQNSSNHRQQQQIRSVVTSQPPPQQNQRPNGGPPQHAGPQPTFIYIPQGQAPPRGTLVSNNGQILTPRGAGMGGHPAYLQAPFCQQPLPMNVPGGIAGPPPQTHMLATAGLPPGQAGLQTYAAHMPPGPIAVNSTLSATSLSSAPTSMGEKVRERKHAIPIIHPVTYENVLETKSTSSNKKLNLNTRQSAPATTAVGNGPSGGADLTPITSTSGGFTFRPPTEAENTLPTNELSYDEHVTTTTMSYSSKMDQQMQTEKQNMADNAAAAVVTSTTTSGDFLTEKLSYTELSERSSNLSMTSGNLAGEDEITNIVKDIIANSEDRLSFLSPQRSWKYKDDKKSNETSHQQKHDSAGSNEDFKKPTNENPPPPPPQQQQQQHLRPKSANKQNTATPISIANAAAEAATGSVATLSAKTNFTAQNPTTKAKSIETIVSTDEPLEKTDPQTVINVNLQQNPLPQRQQRHQTPPAANKTNEKPVRQSSLTSGASSSPASTPTHQQKKNTGKGATTNANNNSNANTNNNNSNPVNGGGGGGGGGNVAGSTGGTNAKKLRKAQKRAKENQKKKNIAISNNKNMLFNHNNNNNSNNNSTVVVAASPSSSSTGRMVADASAEPTTSNQTDSNIINNNKCSSISSSNIISDNSTHSHQAAATAASHTHIQTHLGHQQQQHQQQQHAQQANRSNSNNNSKQRCKANSAATTGIIGTAGGHGILIRGDSTTTDDTLSIATSGSSTAIAQADNKHHIPTEEIVAKFLLSSTPQHNNSNNRNTVGAGFTNAKNADIGSNSSISDRLPSSQEIHQLQFLNSSSSACEDDDVLRPLSTSSTSSFKHRLSEESTTSITELKFGDFSEDQSNSSDQTMISSSTWTSSLSTSTTSTVSSNATVSTKTNKDQQQQSTSSNQQSNENVPALADAAGAAVAPSTAANNNAKPTTGSSGRSHSSSNSKTKKRNPSVASKPAERIKYTIEQLKEMSKLSESRKPPMVPCQKGDCIAQLFVSRQQPHHHSHSQGALSGLHQHLQQQYQHMNYNESMDFVSGKRRGQGKKHQHDQQMGSGNSNSGSGRGNDQRSMDIIRVHLSLKEEIKLSECENAWQPETLRRSMQANADSDDDDLEAVLKKVRGILNKLTPDNFDVLLKTMSSISMNTYEKMQQVMLLIFEKTVSEPNFAPTYAKLCKVLFHEIKAENKSLFTSSLITRIQHEFESNVNDANAKALKLQPLVEKLETCTDTNKRAEMQAELEDQEYQFRRRAWGTVRFIGELYKLQSLTSDRVLICIESLLEHGCEEKLEYMCKLLTTVGHLLEGTSPEQYTNNVRIDKIFRKIQDFVHKSRSIGHKPASIKISSRVRFMMQDVMDLRARNWDQPTTHGVVVSGFTNRQQQQRPMNSNNNNSKHDDKPHFRMNQNSGGMGGSGGNSGSGGAGGNQHQQQRHMGQSRHSDMHNDNNTNYYLQKLQKSHQQNQDHQTVSVDYTKLRFSSVEETTQSTPKLGNSSNYIWRNMSNRPVTNATSGPPPGMSMIKRSSAGAGSAALASAQAAAVGSSGNNPIIMPSYASLASSIGKNQKIIKQTSSSSNASSSSAEANSNLDGFTTKECQQLLNRLTEEALNTHDWENEVLNIWESCNMKQQIAVFHYLLMDYLHLRTIKRQQRAAISNIFHHLMREKAFDKGTFTQVYARFADEFPDLLVDVPNGWAYVFEFIGPLMHKRILHFSDVWQRKWLNDMFFTERFVKAFLNYFTTEFGAKYSRELWHKEYKLDRGQIFWSDFGKFRDFINSNGFGFIEQNLKQQQHHHHNQQFRLHNANSAHSTVEQVERIKYLLNTSDDCDMAIDYINTNVNINSNFIRHLTKFLCCDYALMTVMNTNNNNKLSTNPPSCGGRGGSSANKQQQLNVQLFRHKCIPLLRLCIDAREAHEIACLDEIVVAMKHHFSLDYDDENAANEGICNVFNVLYDCEVIPKESYEKWYRTETENESSSSAEVSPSAYVEGGIQGATDAAAASSSATSSSYRRKRRLLGDELIAFMEKLL